MCALVVHGLSPSVLFTNPSPAEIIKGLDVFFPINIYSFNVCLLHASCVPGTVLNVGDTTVNETDRQTVALCSWSTDCKGPGGFSRQRKQQEQSQEAEAARRVWGKLEKTEDPGKINKVGKRRRQGEDGKASRPR